MKSNLQTLPRRKTIRLKEYDYSSPGAYFVTITCAGGKSLLGRLAAEKVILNRYGAIAAACWRKIPAHFENVSLDAFIVMPSHVHGILFINETEPLNQNSKGFDRASIGVRARHASPLPEDKLLSKAKGAPFGSLGAVVGSYKSAVSREINKLAGKSNSIWHRNYYERVIRNDAELAAIRNYVTYNFLKPISFKDHLDAQSA